MNSDIDSLVFQFENNFGIDGKLEKNFSEKFKILLEEKEIEDVVDFVETTGLSSDIYENYCKGKGDPSLRSITAFCHAYELDYLAFDSLLKAGGYTINYRKKRDCAYAFIITDCVEMSVEECNEFLIKVGITNTKDLLPIPKEYK